MVEAIDVTGLLANIKEENRKYMVYPGSTVTMNNNQGSYLVSMTILPEVMRKALNNGKTWKLFALSHTVCGVNYANPVPKMAEGRIDIRELMGVGTHPIDSVTFKRFKGKKSRIYSVVDKTGYVTELVVTGIMETWYE